MTDTIDDILKLAKVTASDTPTRFLIHKSNNLIDLLYDCIASCYKPGIGFTRGNVSSIKLELNGILYIIKTQQISPSTMDGFITIDQEAIYNKMNEAMIATQNKIFKNDHKSYYTNIDIDILAEY